MPPILDVAIGTFFVFMLFSIAVTALNEVILSFLDKRADFLRLGLGEMLHDSQQKEMNSFVSKLGSYSSKNGRWLLTWVAALVLCIGAADVPWGEAILTGAVLLAVLVAFDYQGWKRWFLGDVLRLPNYKPDTTLKTTSDEVPRKKITVHDLVTHPLIYSFSKGNSHPSYIAADAFAQTLIDLLAPPVVEGQVTAKPDIAALKKAIDDMDPGELKQSLATLIRSAGDDVDKFKAGIEDWFNKSMQRVTGWYKRHAQTWLIYLAFILAVVCNVDSIRIIQTLSNNPNLAKAVAAQAESYVKANQPLMAGVDPEKALAQKREKLKQAEVKLAQIIQPEIDARKKLRAATDAAAKTAAEEELARTVARIDTEKKAAEAALKTAQTDISLPLSTSDLNALREKKDEAIKQARTALKNAQKEGDTAKIEAAQEKLDEAIGYDAALTQFTHDLKALSATGIPMGWDDESHRLFGILKPAPATEAAATTCFFKTIGEWVSRPFVWLKTHIYPPTQWNWHALFPALCGWGLTAIAASLGAPFWFDLLQRIMNLRANGRSPDEKALGTKKPDPPAEVPPPAPAASVAPRVTA